MAVQKNECHRNRRDLISLLASVEENHPLIVLQRNGYMADQGQELEVVIGNWKTQFVLSDRYRV